MPLKDIEKNKAYRRKYLFIYNKKRREESIKKLGGKCVKCFSIENLEFDHIDPKNKSFTIGSFPSINKQTLEKELAKCQILCRSCHKEKNKIDNGEVKHGSCSMYKHKCRCNECKKAWNIYHINYKKVWRQKRREAGFKVT